MKVYSLGHLCKVIVFGLRNAEIRMLKGEWVIPSCIPFYIYIYIYIYILVTGAQADSVARGRCNSRALMNRLSVQLSCVNEPTVGAIVVR